MIGINKIIYEYNNKLLIINVGKKCSVIYNNIEYLTLNYVYPLYITLIK